MDANKYTYGTLLPRLMDLQIMTMNTALSEYSARL